MFDLFNKRKVQDKEREISSLKRALKGMEDEIQKLREQKKTGHEVGDHCNGCKHCVEAQSFNPLFGTSTKRVCALDNNCKDYKPKTQS